MAPEQIRDSVGPLDGRADVYSVGAVLYEMLTGQPPFESGCVSELLIAQLEKPPVPPRRLRPEIPEPLEAIVLFALAKRPSQRFRSADEMVLALDGVLEGAAPDRARRGRASLLGVGFVVAALGIGAAWQGSGRGRSGLGQVVPAVSLVPHPAPPAEERGQGIGAPGLKPVRTLAEVEAEPEPPARVARARRKRAIEPVPDSPLPF
jgi:hypothetical protein